MQVSARLDMKVNDASFTKKISLQKILLFEERKKHAADGKMKLVIGWCLVGVSCENVLGCVLS